MYGTHPNLCVHVKDAYYFMTDRHGIFNVRAFGCIACRTHKGGSGTNKSAQELTQRDRKKPPLTLPHQGIEHRVFGIRNLML